MAAVDKPVAPKPNTIAHRLRIRTILQPMVAIWHSDAARANTHA
jgi:hypothetical protein